MIAASRNCGKAKLINTPILKLQPTIRQKLCFFRRRFQRICKFRHHLRITAQKLICKTAHRAVAKNDSSIRIGKAHAHRQIIGCLIHRLRRQAVVPTLLLLRERINKVQYRKHNNARHDRPRQEGCDGTRRSLPGQIRTQQNEQQKIDRGCHARSDTPPQRCGVSDFVSEQQQFSCQSGKHQRYEYSLAHIR